MRFGVLGPLAVWTSEGDPVQVPGAKVRTLLHVLLVHEGRPVPVDRLVADLWGDRPPRYPAGALQAKVSQLRGTLEAAEPGGRGLVEHGPAGYLLKTEGHTVDAARFEALLESARERDAPAARVELLDEAVGLWRGSAHADAADEEFARNSITRLEEQRLTALEERAEARLELGDHQLLVGELGDLVERHPLRERLRAALLLALYRSGRQSEALASYERLREHLAEELGLDPGPGLVALQRSILARDDTLAFSGETARAATRPATNLPSALTDEPDGGLVGRAEQIAGVRELLAGHRMVTLVGPGGVGKTRLAVETAAQAAGLFPDGMWLVKLADLDPEKPGGQGAPGPEAVARAVAEALGLREATSGQPVRSVDRKDDVERLSEALRKRRLLLLLDTCEHVVEGVAHLVEQLLGAASGVHALATSREPLGVADERVHPVPPLDLPGGDDTGDGHGYVAPPGGGNTGDGTGAEGADRDTFTTSGAVRLFVHRATAASPGFTLHADNHRAVASVCRQLDGIPLALELAAARVPALGVHELAARLGNRFRVLGRGHRTAPRRQQTLRAMIDWSWELLPEGERVVLRRLAVHRGGCVLEAAERVCSGGEVDPCDVLDLLARLLNRSLVVAEDAVGGAEGGGRRRYRLLESVSEYGLERLAEAGEIDTVRAAHAEYFARLAEEEAEPGLRGHLQHEWLRRLDAESANLRSALDWAAARGGTESALRLAGALGRYWLLRGRLREARHYLTSALAATGLDPALPGPGTAMDAPSPVPGRLALRAMTWLTAVGFLDYLDEDPSKRLRPLLRWYEELGDISGAAHARVLCASTMLGSGDVVVVRELAEDALATFRTLGDRWGTASALLVRADLALVGGDLALARTDAEESAALFRAVQDRDGSLRATRILSQLAEIGGDYGTARQLRTEGLCMAEELGLWSLVSEQLASIGRLHLLAGDFTAAADLHERALRIAREQAYGSNSAFAETGLALADRRLGRLDAAEARMRRLVEWNRRSGYVPGVALALAELGFVAELRGDAGAARDLHTEGLAAARDTGDPRAVALAREGLAGASVAGAEPAWAARLLGEAAALRESVGAPLPPAERGDVDRIAAAARAALGAEAFDTLFAEGASEGG